MTILPQKILPKYLALLILTLLSACSLTPEKSVDDMISDAVRNQTTDEGLSATIETPEYFIKLASESTGELQQKYLIKAAELLYLRGDIASAQDQLKDIKAEDIADSRHIQIQLLAAKIALANHNPAQAIELLPKRTRMTIEQYIEISEVRAEANNAMGYLMEAIKTRVHIDPYYKNDEQRENNHTAIWSALNALPSVVLDKLRSSNKTLQGWLELARIIRTAQINSHDLQVNILDWNTNFPEHPVDDVFITKLLEDHTNIQAEDQVIAVLLPMNGPYQAIATAIKGGFMSAYYADNKQANKPTIRFYDTSIKDLDFMALYRRAVEDGANYVVGPLDKTIINQISLLNEISSEFSVPTLALNYSENPLSNANNLYQFGLLPEDEARQVAELAIRQNKTKAAILVPNGLWGQRLKTAFQQRYTELGGTVISSQFFNDKIADYGQSIKQMLNLQHSNNRHKDLQHLLGTELKYSPYRRQDIDMIFLAATPRSARGLVPAFKFHHAGDLPVYSTSHVFSGSKNRSADLDLNGLIFCDVPWTLIGDTKLNNTFNEYWPEQKNYTRLFSLGIDSYHVLYNLNILSKYKYARFAGQTGNIFVDENNRLHRELLWAKFEKGSANYIDTTISPVSSAQIEPN
ncbi:MAG: penicillin-binding protein activator [Gammaproteobacteria bacterium]|nr:penicillin-binding protein activator [Gammaproteobacteria bacterium]